MNVENPYAPPCAAVSDIRGPSEEFELAGRGIRLGFIPAYSLVGPLLIFSDSRPCIHDKLADTIVVVA